MESKISATGIARLRETISQLVQEEKDNLTFCKALSMDIDAFLWISKELMDIWGRLILCAEDPDYSALHHIAAELYGIADESKEFAVQTYEDIELLEQKECAI